MPARESCKLDQVLDFISDTWTLAVLHQLTVGPRRTVELHGSFAGLSSKTLGARLKKLQRGGIVARRSFGESPPRVEYSLTEKGRALLRVLDAIAQVALEWHGDGDSNVAASCQACALARVTAPQEVAPEEAGPQKEDSHVSQKPRKRTDVTLL
jgi:DNA-binding HxlR family transcriptional regulator